MNRFSRMLYRPSRVAAALVSAALMLPVPSQAVASPAAPGVDADRAAVGRCNALAAADFNGLPDAPAQIVSASIGKDDAGRSYCDIRGYIAPQIGIAARLPLSGWNGKLLMGGCGGFCGNLITAKGSPYDDGARRGYAVITTDMGHHTGAPELNRADVGKTAVSPGSVGLWAYANLQGETDFAFRATHATAVLGKAMAKAFYGRKQDHAYFSGCSTGGRQALMEAQRYPEDFDGIIAGAPTLRYATSGFQLLWSALANRRADGSGIMDGAALERLHQGALAACDVKDGLKDGIIANPATCGFRPEALLCRPGQSTNQCLTGEQVAVANRIYQGPVDSKGRAIHVGGAPVGSERNWLGGYFAPPGSAFSMEAFMTDKFRYLGFDIDPGADWTIGSVDWDHDPALSAGVGSLYSATNPDLRRFRDAGGKLIQYHGWTDENVVSVTSTDYYDMATRVMGGVAKTAEFYRLFMIPGMNHCGGGEGATSFDMLTALERWVEGGEAPERLLGRHEEEGRTLFERPVFPYPASVSFTGKGQTANADSFRKSP